MKILKFLVRFPGFPLSVILIVMSALMTAQSNRLRLTDKRYKAKVHDLNVRISDLQFQVNAHNRGHLITVEHTVMFALDGGVIALPWMQLFGGTNNCYDFKDCEIYGYSTNLNR